MRAFLLLFALTVELQDRKLVKTQEHIITQWTAAQVALASRTFPVIGSVRSTLPTGDFELGALSSTAVEGLEHARRALSRRVVIDPGCWQGKV